MVLLHVIYGTQKFDLEVDETRAETSNEGQDSGDNSEPQPNCSEPRETTVADLKILIHSLVNVEPKSQRLILKGKTIFGDTTTLKSLKLREKDKIMVLGTKAQPSEEEMEVSTLKALESGEVAQIAGKLVEYSQELEGIEKGHLPEQHHQDSLRSLEKKLRAVNEECMRILERLDGMSFKEGMNSARAKRKEVVKLVQKTLDDHDVVFERVKAAIGR